MDGGISSLSHLEVAAGAITIFVSVPLGGRSMGFLVDAILSYRLCSLCVSAALSLLSVGLVFISEK